MCYGIAYENSDKKTYVEAEKACESRGGMLARPTNSYTTEALAGQLTYVGIPGRAWIGLNNLDKEGKFRWSDGTALDDPKYRGYSGFPKGEGDNGGWHYGSKWEDCVALDRAKTWHDYRCTVERLFYICEFKYPDPTTTTTVTTPTL